MQETIVAITTPPGMGAIAVLRLSGVTAFEVVDKVFVGKNKLLGQKGYTAHFGKIMDGKRMVDEVVVTLFKNPHSYTGEDVVEVSCHGSTFIQKELLHLFLRSGARMAKPGEFTLRAFVNGKMDLSQAEAVADLISSDDEASHQVALQHMRGGFSSELIELRTELINFASLIELELDFAEEDVEFANRDQLLTLLGKMDRALEKLVNSFDLGNVIKEGIPVAIVGAPNVGKSTLLNALLNEERAIVSDIAGTTRDTVEDEIHLGGLTFRFIDTAGIRETQDEIESIGIKRSLEKVDQSKVVLYLFDASEYNEEVKKNIDLLLERAGNKPVLIVANKSDKLDQPLDLSKVYDHFLPLSAKNKKGIEDLQNALLNLIETGALKSDETIVTNSRHYEALTKSLAAIHRIQEGVHQGISGDFMAQDIREALFHLGEITGEVTTDDLLGNIFQNFCIGK